MKAAYIFIAFFFCCYSVSFAQNNNATQQNALREIQIKAGSAFSNPRSREIENRTRTRDSLSVAQLLNPDSLKNYIYRKSGNTLLTKKLNRQLSVKSKTGSLCQDSSFVRELSTYASYIYINTVEPTADGGFLMPGVIYDTTRKPVFSWRSFGLLIKIDEDGNVLWIKEFDNTDPVTFSGLSMYDAFELTNNDIICVGSIDTTSSSNSYSAIVYRLDKNGNVIWQTGLSSGLFNTYPATSIIIRSVAEGLNGDLIFCGTIDGEISAGKYEMIIRMDNGGNLVWDANYGNYGDYLLGAEGISAYVINGNIVEVGISHGTDYPQISPAINILTLDYNTGNIISKRFFRASYTDKAEEFRKGFTYFTNNCIHLSNGNYIVDAQLYSDFMNVTPEIDHYGIVEFDPNFNLINAYTISSDVQTNYYGNLLYINEDGKGLISLFKYDPSYDVSLYFGAFEQEQFLNQRKVFYSNNFGITEYSGFGYTKDNGYIHVQSIFEGGNKSSVEFRKMHNSDTSSLCLGVDTFFMKFLPLNIIEDPNYLYLDPNISNKLQRLYYNLSQNDTLKPLSVDPCKQLNYCDTVKIHGNPVVCGSQPSIQFTAYKNPECGGIVQWNIDSTGIDSLEIQNDTSVLVHFKNSNWQGKLYASLPAGKCYSSPVDSINVSIIRSQNVLNLGPDTVLCKGDSMVLHAGAAFSTYQWQDGSTDSVFTVAQPGLYFVQVSDACDGIFSDTVIVSPHPPIPFDAGPDRIKCNNDTIQLHATPGFLKYAWLPDYQLNSTVSPDVIANPLTDTTYTVKAEKTPGCFAYDTVHVKVNQSMPINLGADTSFCFGDSVIFNAGNYFSSYTWSNGSAASFITVKTAGTYFVNATSAGGCHSYDTVQVIKVFSNPLVTLDHNNKLCAGDTRLLDAGNFASYLWNDGSSGRTLLISKLGTYFVSVKDDNNCKGSDTTFITNILPLPSGFLPDDTTICSYEKLVINATQGFANYLWSDNTTSTSITVEKAGVYSLEVTDDNNCVGKDSVTVLLKDCMQGFYIPNAFTPNNDGLNDVFKPMIFGNVIHYSFVVYNRFGQKVFESTDLSRGWDGRFNNTDSPADIFVWTCSYQLAGGNVENEKGTVMLIR